MYTSGSTGVPKGVTVTHANLAARVRWMVDAYELGPDDRIVQFASLSFDAHAEEIFPALAAGARVVLLPEGGASLPDFLAASPDVAVLDLPTAYWHQLVDLIDEIAWPEALRLVILGGQQASGAAVDRWRERFGRRVRLVNTYGPTEATIIATAADLAGGDVRPPIGRPIGATGVAVLDRAGRRVPPGVVGELAIGGAGVAAGYRARPALTAERFVPDPQGEPGARRYLTGDLVRWRGDGELEFLGRLDDQVKVRGFRVEPGEVETAILGHPAISEAAVIARDDVLVAYVVARAADPAAGDELRRHLAGALPAHLVPDVVVHVDRLPLTAAGKVDRAALAGIAPRPALPETGEAGRRHSLRCGTARRRRVGGSARAGPGARQRPLLPPRRALTDRPSRDRPGARRHPGERARPHALRPPRAPGPRRGRRGAPRGRARRTHRRGGAAPARDDGGLMNDTLVVLNDEEQYSIWPTGLPIPAGWRPEGFAGTRAACLPTSMPPGPTCARAACGRR